MEQENLGGVISISGESLPATERTPSPKSKGSARGRESRLREDQIRAFLQSTYPDKLYFPTEDIPRDVEYRWVREECRGVTDLSRISYMTKKGWTPVPFARHPTFLADTSWGTGSCKPDVIRVDGLILCERPKEYGRLERKAQEQQNKLMMSSIKWVEGMDKENQKEYINKTTISQSEEEV